MLVAHVPGRDPSGEHAAVVGLGVAHRHRVLPGVEQFVLGGLAVVAQVSDRVALQLNQLLDGLALAALSGSNAAA